MKHFYALSFAFFSFVTFGQVTPIENGKDAPMMDHSMKDVSGKETSIKAQSKANGVVVVFSCNTCPFVVGSDDFAGWEGTYPAVKTWADSLGFGMILINSNEAKRKDEDSFEAMKKRASEKKYAVPYVVDANSEVANAFGAKTTPHVFVIDANGKVVYQGAIDNTVDPTRKQTDHYLKSALISLQQKQPLTWSTTPPRGCSIKRK